MLTNILENIWVWAMHCQNLCMQCSNSKALALALVRTSFDATSWVRQGEEWWPLAAIPLPPVLLRLGVPKLVSWTCRPAKTTLYKPVKVSAPVVCHWFNLIIWLYIFMLCRNVLFQFKCEYRMYNICQIITLFCIYHIFSMFPKKEHSWRVIVNISWKMEGSLGVERRGNCLSCCPASSSPGQQHPCQKTATSSTVHRNHV